MIADLLKALGQWLDALLWKLYELVSVAPSKAFRFAGHLVGAD